MIGNYQLPPLDFLQHPDLTVKPTESKEELMANARLMQQTLAQFDIEVALGDITKGPTITRYELHPAPGVKLEKITALNNNIAAALKAERIHILAPVPGKSSVGVEVPNPIKTKVIMRDLLESEEWRNTKARIPLALGKDVYGHPIIADLSEMPHLLIAGSTGSGKSVCINAIITSLLYRFSPDQLRFVMIDPKVVELQQYNALPHLVVPVVTDPKKVILALRWVVNEMEKRYQIFARVGVRNILSFNSRPKNKPLPPREPELPLLAKARTWHGAASPGCTRSRPTSATSRPGRWPSAASPRWPRPWGRTGRARPDVVLAMSPPLTLGLAGWAVARARAGAVRVQHPGRVPGRRHRARPPDQGERVIAAATWLERTTYRRADAVTVLSDDLADNVRAKIAAGHAPRRAARARARCG